MTAATLLGLLIGLVFLYLLLSTLCSSLTSALSYLLGMRAKGVAKGIDRLITEKNLSEAFYQHPLITSLETDGGHLQIPSASYSMALLDVAVNEAKKLESPEGAPAEGAVADGVENLEQLIGKLPDSQTRTLLLTVINNSEKKVDSVLKNLGDSYDAAMGAVSQWYEKNVHWFLIGFAALICTGLNIDTIAIAGKLWGDSAFRSSIDAAAAEYIEKNGGADATPQALKSQFDTLTKLHFPLLWSAETVKQVDSWPLKAIGILLTIIATAAGAPFWYNLLRRLVGFRGPAGRPQPSG